jgi:uncharacterized Tic20 family protein
MSYKENEAGQTAKLPAVPPGKGPQLGVTQSEMNMAMLAHASIVLTVLLAISTGGLAAILGAAIPAAIWYGYRDKSAYVSEQARQATLFQVAGFVALLLLVIGWTVSAALVIVLVGIVLLPIMLVVTLLLVVLVVALPIGQLVYGLYGAVEAYHGRPFRYAWISDLVDRYQARA